MGLLLPATERQPSVVGGRSTGEPHGSERWRWGGGEGRRGQIHSSHPSPALVPEFSGPPTVLPGTRLHCAESGPVPKGRAIKITGPLLQRQGHLPAAHLGSHGGSSRPIWIHMLGPPAWSPTEDSGGKAGEGLTCPSLWLSYLTCPPGLVFPPDLSRLSTWLTPTHPLSHHKGLFLGGFADLQHKKRTPPLGSMAPLLGHRARSHQHCCDLGSSVGLSFPLTGDAGDRGGRGLGTGTEQRRGKTCLYRTPALCPLTSMPGPAQPRHALLEGTAVIPAAQAS